MSANVESMDFGAAGMSSRRWVAWVGRALSAIPVLMMLMSAAMKLSANEQAVHGFVDTFGYLRSTLPIIAALELASVVLYAIPRTAVFGAIVMTGYLGGAVATHVRVGDPAFVGAVIMGVIAWAGLYLREPRLRALVPLRRQPRA